ncbi:putative subtilase-type serine protease precursor [Posidoniimonas polymericola]|uniref:Putative subtilase-type serine protease n=1 Tax=Posidoniimonas polymericola TaxID=2528002 RepID=A0A5C5YU20_9BACT|nr:PPC domain-containing protein [Posidoniimonas polymericola]TWT78514.1 putative subtilase-type serine protease precursor [Posidoniimonas polymericola]
MRHATQTLVALLLSLGVALRATAYEPRLSRLEPAGGRQGTTVSVDFVGGRIGIDPAEVVFYEPGLKTVALERVDDNRTRVQLEIEPDCPLGRHELRLRTNSGLSEIRTFHIGVLPEVTEVDPNDSLDAPQAIEFGSTVNGVIKREDIDCFAFNANEGQRVSVEVEGLRMGRTFFDPLLELLDEGGQVIAECDDAAAAHQDAFLSVTAPHTGRYIVRLRETAYRGDDNCVYRLHVGEFPRPDAVFPPAAARGVEVEVAWIGGNGGKQQVRMPSEGDQYEYWPEDERGTAPSALPIKLLDAPPAAESEPNNNRNEPNPMPAPGGGVGVLAETGDQDWYSFEAKKGQVWELRVQARELRSPLDAVLRVFTPDGKNLAGNDDDRGAPDPYIRFTAPEEGTYLLQVSDRMDRGQPDYVYYVEAAERKAIAEVKIEERRRYEATVLEVPRGGKTATLLTVTRRDLGGELRVDFENLPPGVTAEAFPLAANYNRVPVVFSATEEAPLAAALAPLEVSPTEGEQPIETQLEQQTWFARGRNNRPMWSHFAKRAAVAVTDPLPFRIRIEPTNSPLVQGGAKDLKIIADRNEGFDEAIRIYTLYNPPGVSSNRSRSITKGQNEAIIPATANGNATTGDWQITVVGELNSGGRVYASTPFAKLTVAEPYFDMKVPTVNSKQGEEVELTLELNQRHEFDGEAELTLVRLPPGVAAEPTKVTKDATSATFKLVIAADAKPGRHRGLGCQAKLTVTDEPVVYTQGYSEVRVDPRPAANATADANNGSNGSQS